LTYLVASVFCSRFFFAINFIVVKMLIPEHYVLLVAGTSFGPPCTGLCVYIQNGASALLMASEQGHINIVKILLQHNARVDVFDEVTHLISLFTFQRRYLLTYLLTYCCKCACWSAG